MRHLVAFLEPLGITWIGLTLSLLLLIRMRRWKTGGVVAFIWLVFSVCACTSLPSHLLHRLERPWLDTDLESLPRADIIISLGGAGEASTRELNDFHFRMSTDRLVTAVELIRRGKAGALVIGGGGASISGEVRSEADAATAWIKRWKLTDAPVISLGRCLNTRDEALRMAALANEKGWKTFILVTSANHMRRAKAVFHRAGLEVTCAPCNYLSPQSRERVTRMFHAPDVRELDAFNVWFHETAGWYAYRWRGWL